MATEEQFKANRANAKRSTGPKTAAGKLKSSRNAFRHGLSASVPLEPATLVKIDSIARVVAGEQTTEIRLTSAADFASAQMELFRIGAIRTEHWTRIDLEHGPDIRELKRLAALDRYERYALTRRRRAARKLGSHG